MRGGTWWDFYNVSQFLHAAPFHSDVFILSMPLKGVNRQHGYGYGLG